MTKSILIAACMLATTLGGVDAQTSTSRNSSGVVLLNVDDAPAEVSEAQLIPGVLGAPEAVRVTVRNRMQEPLAIEVDALLFDGKGILRMQSFSGPRRQRRENQSHEGERPNYVGNRQRDNAVLGGYDA